MKKKSLLLTPFALSLLLTSCGTSSSISSTGSSNYESTGSSSSSQSSTSVETPAKYSLMRNWAGNLAEELYEVEETDTQTIITYTDVTGELSGGWEYVARSFAYDRASIDTFDEYKKFSFTGKLETTSGSDVVMVKVEGSGGTYEKKFNFSSEVATYEFSTSFISDWTYVSQILLFVNRSTSETGSGRITLDNFELSKENVNPNYDIAAEMPSEPQDWNIYSNGQTKLNVMTTWGYDTTGDISTVKIDENTYNFTWGGEKEKTSSWSYVSSKIKAAEDSDITQSGFKRLHFKVNGTAGKSALLKFQAADNSKAKEMAITLNGEDQEFDLDVDAIVNNSDEVNQFLAVIFPDQNAQGTLTAGELTLKECYLDQNSPAKDPTINYEENYEVKIQKFASIDSCFTVNTIDDDTFTIAYNKTAVGYESVQASVSGDNLSSLTSFTGTVTSTVVTHLIIKPYDNTETKYTLAANTPTEISIDVPTSTINKDKKTIFMMAYEADDALAGILTFSNVKYAMPAVNGLSNGKYPINTIVPNNKNEGVYTITNNNGVNEIAYTKKSGSEWSAVVARVQGETVPNMDSYQMTLESDKDVSVLIKPFNNGANEYTVTLKANVAQTIVREIPNKTSNTLDGIYMFIAPGVADNSTGTVKISNFSLLKANHAETNEVNINKVSTYESCYTVNETTDAFTVNFDKDNTQKWNNVQAVLGGDVSTFTHVTGTVESTVDVHVIIKPYDNSSNEKSLTLTANTAQSIDYSLEAANINSDKPVYFFIAWDDNDPLQGSVTFTNLKFSKAA